MESDNELVTRVIGGSNLARITRQVLTKNRPNRANSRKKLKAYARRLARNYPEIGLNRIQKQEFHRLAMERNLRDDFIEVV